MSQTFAEKIGDTGYVGWLVWVDDVPIFQAIPHNPDLMQTAAGLYTQPVRRAGRNTVDWNDLPHDRIKAIDLFGLHEFYTHQPLFHLDKEPGTEGSTRFCCLTMGAVAFHGRTGAGVIEGGGAFRTGIAGWKIGYFMQPRKEFMLWKVDRHGRTKIDFNGDAIPEGSADHQGHPCHPRPQGYALSPHVFGLKDSDVWTPDGTERAGGQTIENVLKTLDS